MSTTGTENPRIPGDSQSPGPNMQLIGVAALAAAQWVAFLLFMAFAVSRAHDFFGPGVGEPPPIVQEETAAIVPAEEPTEELIATGEGLYRSLGCEACHSLDGSDGIGPTFQGLYGRERMLEAGFAVVADDAYLTESIVYPDARRVVGYESAAMPNYGSLMTDRDVEALVAFIKSIP